MESKQENGRQLRVNLPQASGEPDGGTYSNVQKGRTGGQ
jgi:hypothetical protein